MTTDSKLRTNKVDTGINTKEEDEKQKKMSGKSNLGLEVTDERCM